MIIDLDSLQNKLNLMECKIKLTKNKGRLIFVNEKEIEIQK